MGHRARMPWDHPQPPKSAARVAREIVDKAWRENVTPELLAILRRARFRSIENGGR